MTTIIYRQSKQMPPDEESYVSMYEKRLQRGQRPSSNPMVDRASRGLSVITTLEDARAHAEENKRLGAIIVRYEIPDDVDFRLEHIIGKASHLTLTMDPLTNLALYLDMEWWEVQHFDQETAGD